MNCSSDRSKPPIPAWYRRPSYWAFAALVSFLGFAVWQISGCPGMNGERQAVSGSVRVHSRPLAAGTVKFICQALPENQLGFTDAHAAVIDGEFTIPQPIGLRPGLYYVQVIPAAAAAAPATDSCSADSCSADPGFLITIRGDGVNQIQLGD